MFCPTRLTYSLIVGSSSNFDLAFDLGGQLPAHRDFFLERKKLTLPLLILRVPMLSTSAFFGFLPLLLSSLSLSFAFLSLLFASLFAFESDEVAGAEPSSVGVWARSGRNHDLKGKYKH